VLAAAAVAASQVEWGPWVQAFRTWIEGLGLWGYLAFTAAYVVAAVLLIPVWPLSITGGLAFGAWGFIWVPISATLGASAAFLISRYFARGKIREWLVHRPRYRAVDEAVGEEGWKIVALLRVSPLVPYNLMNYFCGMTQVCFTPFLLATFFGSIPVAAMYVYLGMIGQAVAGGTMTPLQMGLLVVGLAATVAVTVLITRKVRPKLDRIGVPSPGRGT
jgi:uncharacterized membrane protein YdjX (TVP38/TMEM64 family)